MYSKKLSAILLLSCFVATSVVAQNVMISDNNSPNEPSIMMNPLNTDILVAGANLNNVYNSSDGGLTWSEQQMTSTYGVWGDPTFDVDTEGNFYYFHLSNPASGVPCEANLRNHNSMSSC